MEGQMKAEAIVRNNKGQLSDSSGFQASDVDSIKFPTNYKVEPLPIFNVSMLDSKKSKRGQYKVFRTLTNAAKKDFEHYLKTFARGGLEGRFIMQREGEDWFTLPFTPSRREFVGHLDGDFWIGTPSPWYPVFAIIDIDSPSDYLKALEKLKDKLGLDEGQYAAFTSPSFFNKHGPVDNSTHAMIRPTYNDSPPTAKLLDKVLSPVLKGLHFELYPNVKKQFRLPLGKFQYLLDGDGYPQIQMGWQEAFRKILNIDPFSLEQLPYQNENNREIESDFVDKSPQKREAEELLRNGLVYEGTRHEATGILARYYYFRNIPPKEAKLLIRDFFVIKHNNKSKEINHGNWNLVEREIANWVNSTYEYFSNNEVYPSHVSAGQGWISKKDIEFIISVFPNDYINQKRLFKLISYCRPRQKDGWTRIHRNKWIELIGSRNVAEFRKALINKNLLNIHKSYQVGAYSQKYSISHLPNSGSEEALKDTNGVEITDYLLALKMLFKSHNSIIEATGISRRSLYN